MFTVMWQQFGRKLCYGYITIISENNDVQLCGNNLITEIDRLYVTSSLSKI